MSSENNHIQEYYSGVMFQMMLGTLVKYGFSIKEFSFKTNTGTLRAQNADLVIVRRHVGESILIDIEAKHLDTSTNSKSNTEVFTIDTTNENFDINKVLSEMFQKYPPTGHDILTSFINLAFRNNLKVEVVYKNNGAHVSITHNAGSRTFRMESPESMAGTKIVYNENQAHVKTPEEVLTWVTTQ